MRSRVRVPGRTVAEGISRCRGAIRMFISFPSKKVGARTEGRPRLFQTALLTGLAVVLGASGSAVALAKTSGVSKADLEHAAAQVAKYTKPPTFVSSGPKFDTKSLKGKVIYDIPVASDIPFNASIVAGEQAAALKVGAKVVLWPNTGETSQWVTGMDTAISTHAGLIVLLGPNPAVLEPQLAEAKAAGIPVIETHDLGAGATLPTGIAGSVPAPFGIAGRLMADYAIHATKGHVNAIIVVSKDATSTGFVDSGLLGEFKKYCGSACKLDVINVPIPNWASSIPTEVESALIKDTSANIVIPIYDGMVASTVTGIRGANAQSRVKVVTFNGTPSVLSLIKTGGVAMDVGESTPWIGWSDMDLAFRILTQNKQVEEPAVWVRVWDKANVDGAGIPPAIGVGYGNAFVAGFEKEWKVTK